MQRAVFFQALNGDNCPRDSRTHGYLAGAARGSINQHGARAAHAFAAAILRPRQAEFVAQYIKQRSIWRIANWIAFAVDFEFDASCHAAFLRRIPAPES